MIGHTFQCRSSMKKLSIDTVTHVFHDIVKILSNEIELEVEIGKCETEHLFQR